MSKRSSRFVSFSRLSLLVAFSLLLGRPAFAISDADIVQAIEKAKVLAPNIRMNARISKDEVEVSTYKNPKANDDDCKIEAVLVAKTVMELAPELAPRVVVYFYSSNALSRFKQVSVSSGDVKAFGAGSTGREELLRSIVIKEDYIADPGKRVANYMSEGQILKTKRVVTTLRGDRVDLATTFDSSMGDKLLKMEALRLGEQALEAAPSEYKQVDITFQDVASKERKLVSFDRAKLTAINDGIEKALKELVIAQPAAETVAKLDYQNYEVKEGLRQDERKALFERLKVLDKAGVGVGKVVTDQFMEIESDSATATDADLMAKIDKLGALLSKFEQNLKNAKEFKPAAAKGGEKPAANPGAGANDSELKARVLANPDGHLAAMAAGLARTSPTKNGEDHPNYPKILQYVIDTLKANGRSAEAAKYEQKLEEIKARNH